ncbi:MAG: ABC transporter substrate-binding protein [Spirochaetales bacterium]|uniref:Thiamine pyrimidine synthase n=1 Tax=Candidatus Thalassospirochaeta sargassi TaxID=3119039 RepID=A0AAJ1IEG1_9SPIO|nr:ABC transporter substrate-binding protein [Spirochaetales bacterium]
MNKKIWFKTAFILIVFALAVSPLFASGSQEDMVTTYYDADASVESIVVDAATKGQVGNWGIGNEYEIQALLTKYGQPTTYLSQAFDMDGFDDDSILLASAMTYNELGLVKNSYDGGYGYGDTVSYIDMNDEGVAMLEDNIFCNAEFAAENPETVKAFVYASMKGWEYACANVEEAAEIVYNYGSSVSAEHQLYMAGEIKKLVETDTKGNTVTEYGKIDKEAVLQSMELAKTYVKLEDSVAAENLSNLTIGDLVDSSYWEAAAASNGDFDVEKSEITVQLKWLPQAQFMGYYVALDKGYYDEVGLDVTVVPGGGDIGETTAVYTGQVDFGVTWIANLMAANAGGMDLIEVAQVFQRSGIVLVYKLN